MMFQTFRDVPDSGRVKRLTRVTRKWDVGLVVYKGSETSRYL